MVVIAWVIRAFGLPTFGRFATIDSLVRLIDLLFGLGSPLWIRKVTATTVEDGRADVAAAIRRFFFRGLAMSAAAATGLLLWAPSSLPAYALVAATMAVPFAIANRQTSALLSASGRPLLATVTQPTIRIATMVGAIVLSSKNGAAPLVLAASVTSVSTALILTLHARRALGLTFMSHRPRFTYSTFLPFHVRELVNAGFEYLVVLTVGIVGTDELAGTTQIFTKARVVALTVYTALIQILQRRMGQAVYRKDWDALQRVLSLGGWISTGVAVLVQLGLIVTGRVVVPLAGIPADWNTLVSLHVLLTTTLIAGYFFGLPLLLDFVDQARFQANLIGSVRVVQLGMIAALIRPLGILGFAAPIAIGAALIYAAMFVRLKRVSGFVARPSRLTVSDAVSGLRKFGRSSAPLASEEQIRPV